MAGTEGGQRHQLLILVSLSSLGRFGDSWATFGKVTVSAGSLSRIPSPVLAEHCMLPAHPAWRWSPPRKWKMGRKLPSVAAGPGESGGLGAWQDGKFSRHGQRQRCPEPDLGMLAPSTLAGGLGTRVGPRGPFWHGDHSVTFQHFVLLGKRAAVLGRAADRRLACRAELGFGVPLPARTRRRRRRSRRSSASEPCN